MYPFSIVNNKILKGHSIILCRLSRKDNQTVVDNNQPASRAKGTGNKDIFVLTVGWARFPIKFINSELSLSVVLQLVCSYSTTRYRETKAIKNLLDNNL